MPRYRATFECRPPESTPDGAVCWLAQLKRTADGWELSPETFDKVVAAINDPPNPSPALIAAAERYKALVATPPEEPK